MRAVLTPTPRVEQGRGEQAPAAARLGGQRAQRTVDEHDIRVDEHGHRRGGVSKAAVAAPPEAEVLGQRDADHAGSRLSHGDAVVRRGAVDGDDLSLGEVALDRVQQSGELRARVVGDGHDRHRRARRGASVAAGGRVSRADQRPQRGGEARAGALAGEALADPGAPGRSREPGPAPDPRAHRSARRPRRPGRPLRRARRRRRRSPPGRRRRGRPPAGRRRRPRAARSRTARAVCSAAARRTPPAPGAGHRPARRR